MSAAETHLRLLSQWAATVDTGSAYQTGHKYQSIDGMMRCGISYIVM